MNFSHKKAIIGQTSGYGGLGDNFQLSTLPEMFAACGVETYISNQNICRNSQIYEMVWGLNPFVKGIASEPPNITINDIENSYGVCQFNTVQRAEMLFFGDWKHSLPVTFYRPKLRDDFVNKMVLEFGYVTVNLTASLSKIKEHLSFITDGQEVVLLKNPVNAALDVGDYPTYEVKDIFELADILFSCRIFAGIESGAAVLCATVKGFNRQDGAGQFVFCRQIHQTMRAFVYPTQTLVVVA